MKRNITTIRAQKMLESDRLGLANGAEEIITRDIENLLAEYFMLKNKPSICIDGAREHITISISASAKGVKRFYLLK